jgi:hypothetical protein
MPHLTWQPISAATSDQLLTLILDPSSCTYNMLRRWDRSSFVHRTPKGSDYGDLTFISTFIDPSLYAPCYDDPSSFIRPFYNPKPSVVYSSLLFFSLPPKLNAIQVRTRRLRPHFEYAPINTIAAFSAIQMDLMTRGWKLETE